MKSYRSKLSKRDVAKRHLYKMKSLSAYDPNNKYYKDQVKKTEKLLGYA